MPYERIKDWIEIVGMMSIVASLVFVGLQIKLTREIALSNTYQARASAVIEMVTANAANEKGLAAWYAPDAASIEALSPAEVRAGNQMAISLLLAYDNMLFQHESGFISADGWAAGRADMKNILREPFVRQSFESQVRRMRPTFKAVFDAIIGELDAEQRK